MPIIDEGFEPVPALTEPLAPDDELTLQDALADPSTAPVSVSPPAPLGRAPAFDFIDHRLVPGVAGGPLMTRGVPTLATWIEKCLRTRRGENPAVDANFGCDILAEDLLGEGLPFDPSAVAEYAAAIDRALRVHPRITGVENIAIDGDLDDDAVSVSFTATIDGDDVEDLTFSRTIGA
jgi:hypothetical protein